MEVVRSGAESAVPAKLCAMAVLGGAALIASLLPVLLARRCATSRVFLDYLLRLGGGILLATTLLHLLPEVREGVEGLSPAPSLPVQLPELLMCAGFFLMYGLEELAHRYLGHHHHHDMEKASLHPASQETEKAHTPLRAILITLAISIHQLFEGMAVGLEVHPGQVWILTGAIAAHKVVIAVCVGAESIGSPPCSLALLLASFSLATPLGIALGLGLTAEPGLVSVLLQGLAAGTLLFVVFFEVLQRQGPHLGHCLVTALGFLLMLGLLCLFQS